MEGEVKDKYTPKEIARFNELYQKLLNADKQVEEYKTNPSLQPLVLRKRFVLITLGEHLPNYEREVPQDVRNAFGFDVKGLVKKVNNLCKLK